MEIALKECLRAESGRRVSRNLVVVGGDCNCSGWSSEWGLGLRAWCWRNREAQVDSTCFKDHIGMTMGVD